MRISENVECHDGEAFAGTIHLSALADEDAPTLAQFVDYATNGWDSPLDGSGEHVEDVDDAAIVSAIEAYRAEHTDADAVHVFLAVVPDEPVVAPPPPPRPPHNPDADTLAAHRRSPLFAIRDGVRRFERADLPIDCPADLGREQGFPDGWIASWLPYAIGCRTLRWNVYSGRRIPRWIPDCVTYMPDRGGFAWRYREDGIDIGVTVSLDEVLRSAAESRDAAIDFPALSFCVGPALDALIRTRGNGFRVLMESIEQDPRAHGAAPSAAWNVARGNPLPKHPRYLSGWEWHWTYDARARVIDVREERYTSDSGSGAWEYH